MTVGAAATSDVDLFAFPFRTTGGCLYWGVKSLAAHCAPEKHAKQLWRWYNKRWPGWEKQLQETLRRDEERRKRKHDNAVRDDELAEALGDPTPERSRHCFGRRHNPPVGGSQPRPEHRPWL